MKNFLLLLCVFPSLCHSALANEKRRPNVVILLTDDQGTLDVNCYGSTDLRTPHMDRIAATGVRFTQAYAHAVCCPARAALFTGRHPQRSGVVNWTQGDRHGSDAKNTRMAAEETTLAEAMKNSGYTTALFGKWHLGANNGYGPLDQGFSTHFGHLGGFIDNYRHYFLHGRGYHDLWEGNQEIFRTGEYYPDFLTDRAVQFIDAHKHHPFFMTVAFNLPHYPEQPSATFKDAYADLPMPRRSYARVISTVDEHIGKILKKLEDTGLRDDTIVIFMSDNGHSVEDNAGISVDQHASGYPKGHYYLAHAGGGNTGKWKGHKGTFFEGGIRVPAMISYPAQLPQGEVRDQIVTIMDWFPTVLELCGIPLKDNAPPLDGRSMTGIIRDAQSASAHEILHFAWAQNWCVRKGDWKLIQQHNRASAKDELSLHNLAEPQPEEKNHAAEQPQILKELQSLHNQWQTETSAPR
jgi:arylsulfatase A